MYVFPSQGSGVVSLDQASDGEIDAENGSGGVMSDLSFVGGRTGICEYFPSHLKTVTDMGVTSRRQPAVYSPKTRLSQCQNSGGNVVGLGLGERLCEMPTTRVPT